MLISILLMLINGKDPFLGRKSVTAVNYNNRKGVGGVGGFGKVSFIA